MTRGSKLGTRAALLAALAAVALPGVAWAKHGRGDDGESEGGGKTCSAYVVTGFTNGATIGKSGLRTTAKAGVVGATLTVTGASAAAVEAVAAAGGTLTVAEALPPHGKSVRKTKVE